VPCCLDSSFQGEVCVAGSRVYVQEGIYDEFVKKAVEAAQNWKVGDPFDATSNMGPQVKPHPKLKY
jgi:coniferyl-aldehyde dehydrogenase